MDTFPRGSMITFKNPYGIIYTGEIIRCYDTSCEFRVVNYKIPDPPPRYGHIQEIGDIMRVSKSSLKPGPLNEMIAKKRRHRSIQEALEARTGLNAGPGTWANRVRAYSGNTVPRGAEGAFGNERVSDWVRVRRQEAGRTRRQHKKRSRKTRRH
jgi:hypothetical protein